MKNFIVILWFTIASSQIYGQVGINTLKPAVTLDVAASTGTTQVAEGVLAPRLSGADLATRNASYGADQNGAILYVTIPDPAPKGKTQLVTNSGYYYYDATADNGTDTGMWIPFNGTRVQMYMPSVVLPIYSTLLPETTNYSFANGVFSVNLFNLYFKQFQSPMVRSDYSAKLKTKTLASDYDFFVLYYDTSVYSSVAVNDKGVLTYSVLPNAIVTEKTFMNLMLREK